MQLPETLEVMNRTYKVVECDLTESSYIGLSKTNTGEIKIERSLDNQEKAVTFLHEIIHTILTAMGHRSGEGGSPLHTEQNVDTISKGLATVMRDNSDIIKDIIDNLERDDLGEEE